MEKTWQWVTSVLDVAEGQLRQGQYFETQVCMYVCMYVRMYNVM